ncbi:hypothetical protein GLOIN_2v1645742 [Rhizophagus irregularis DAOM 181602=DAOM 197198]|uniref:Uncharacterized protein n=1 Tax=Rhizophagus irregularis (strain DAOM 181602 / DAOM 197198 / MUCL 43194) TaxID=747089 RepID=A0A2P4PQI9_RHIID|nr:hypothetical protein GLOIN_2v1645742 [Rhizophagus irregularis DAOM 181602=DAOM 197198]POG67622.1 hypothetical protein GLOIN_2v1645742 [Rhizophagus irregularis DAOM 181602=DAOM 197198]|eukprot:XP_025174488.1 hypothetical protein GLOIN_2v1645742 [Rhizophagus irregularis DAOM 181602=DAOM 197198]
MNNVLCAYKITLVLFVLFSLLFRFQQFRLIAFILTHCLFFLPAISFALIMFIFDTRTFFSPGNFFFDTLFFSPSDFFWYTDFFSPGNFFALITFIFGTLTFFEILWIFLKENIVLTEKKQLIII